MSVVALRLLAAVRAFAFARSTYDRDESGDPSQRTFARPAGDREAKTPSRCRVRRRSIVGFCRFLAHRRAIA